VARVEEDDMNLRSRPWLWTGLVICVAFILAGIFIYWADPGQWQVAVITIVIFGAFAIAPARLLFGRRADPHPTVLPPR
jgi:Na+-translocating ferredoxin:NAD+ oxidoreductase RnfD subunit